MEELNALTERIIGSAIEVHRHLGPGLLEGTYEAALAVELEISGIQFRRQATFPVLYKSKQIGECRVDFLIEDAVVVELKSVERLEPVFEAQVLTYLKVSGKKLGLLINFNSRLLRDGLKRLIL